MDVEILMEEVEVDEWLECVSCKEGWMGELKDATCDWCGYGPLCDFCCSIRNHSPCQEKFYP